MKKKLLYNGINIIVLLVMGYLFVVGYRNFEELFVNVSAARLTALVGMVLAVHLVKALRLYLALYGSGLGGREYLKTYCKVTPVSVIFPFKLGEFFRMYCYGNKIRNYLKGVIIILFDRFMDTLALVTAVLLVCLINGSRIPMVVYVLIGFLFALFAVFFIFPGMYEFWRRFFIREKATKRRITALKILSRADYIYKEVSIVSKGRGILLYVLSLLAWVIEILTLVFSGATGSNLSETISGYLISAVTGNTSVELSRFIFVSVIIMVILFCTIKLTELFTRRRSKN